MSRHSRYDVIEIDSDYDEEEYGDDDDDDVEGEDEYEVEENYGLMNYLLSRAADLAAAGIVEGDVGAHRLQHQADEEQERRGRDDNYARSRNVPGHGRQNNPQSSPAAVVLEKPSNPPKSKSKSKSRSKSKSKVKPESKPVCAPDDMMVDATCIICYSAVTNTVLIPCGHLILCAACCDEIGATEKKVPGKKTAKCPICREVVLDRMTVYRC